MYNMEKMLMLAVLGVCTGVAGSELTTTQRGTLARQALSVQHVAGQAETMVREANELYLQDKYREAIARYIDAKQLFERFNTPDFAKRVKACDDQIRKCYANLADDAYKAAEKSASEKDFDAALAAVREAAKLYPEGESRAQAKIAELETRKKAAAMRAQTGTEAMVPAHESQAYRIDILLRQGQALARAGRYSEAAQKFSSVLMIDPYHAVALQDLKAANARDRKSAELRYRSEHRKIITETEWSWAVPGVVEASEAKDAEDGPVEKELNNNVSELEKKIKSIILPEFKVEKCTVPAVVRALQEASRIYDPEKGADSRHGRGVNIFLRRPNALQAAQQAQPADGMDAGMPGADMGPAPMPAPAPVPAPANANSDDEDVDDEEAGASANEQTVTMDVRKRSLESALRDLCRTAKLRMRIDSHAVVLAPENVALDDMETALFPVEKEVFGSVDAADKKALRTFFEEHNIPFPNGAKVAYVALLSRLVVTNTAENLAAMQELLQELHENREPLVEVTTKFVEVQQSNLKELGFNYNVSYNANNAPYPAPGHSSSKRLSFTGASSLRTQSAEPMVDVHGSISGADGLDYSVAVHAMNQLSSSDVLASPRIITRPGVQATIKMVKKQQFVDEYEEADIEQSTGGSNNTNYGSYSYISPMPSFEDEATEMGIMMDVTPEVNKESGKITLDLKPFIRTFMGYDEYVTETLDSVELMRKPIFAEREINTRVTVNDGKTIVIGGVVEDTSNILNDKVPILGDLPLVGRFFQSRATDANKRHLLIFITCRLINPDGTSYTQTKVAPNGLPQSGRLY